MQPATYIEKSVAIAFDAEVMSAPQRSYFEEGYWRSQNAVTGTAMGRGNSWFVDAPFGHVVLRQYLRGGWAARISRDRYFYTGVDRSRPFQEFSVLVALLDLGLPVPKPVAALCDHRGMFSRGSLITHAVENVQTLAHYLPQSLSAERQAAEMQSEKESVAKDHSAEELAVQKLAADPPAKAGIVDSKVWRNTGRCIRRFHAAGLWHADLNARNILVDADQTVYLIDFDRARFTPGNPVDGQNNLARLKRSLQKICRENHDEFVSMAWTQLMEGYDE